MDGYLAKPVRSHDLLALVETLACERIEASGPSTTFPTAAKGSEFSAALARMDGDMQIFAEQIDLFLAGAPQLLERIRNAIAQHDARDVEVAAHRLRGFAAAFDAHSVVDAASRLEEMGRERELSTAQRARMRAAYRLAGPGAVAGFRTVLEAMMDPEMRRHFATFKEGGA